LDRRHFWITYFKGDSLSFAMVILDQAAGLRRAPCKGGAFPVGAKPTRSLSLRPEATGAVREVTSWLKPLV